MREKTTDNYVNFALLGNNIYDMCFMNNLLLSQNVNSFYCDKYKIDDNEKETILKNIAYYFGTRVPILIDNKGLRKLFDENDIPNVSILPNLCSEDIIHQINMCLNSDAVYVCNSDGNLDKYTMFILGYLMAQEQEIFLWNHVDKSEWLMSCISFKNNKDFKEVVQFPLEIIRSFAYPYFFQNIKSNLQPGKYCGITIDKEGNIGVDRNIEFNLQVDRQDCKKNTISLLGSLRKQLNVIRDETLQLEKRGYEVLAPKLSNIETDENGFLIFEDDISDNPVIIESAFIENCLKSERILVCDKDGYIGNTVMFELGYLLAKKKEIKFLQEPSECWLRDTVNYYSRLNDQKTLLKHR